MTHYNLHILQILNEYEMPAAVREYFPGGWYMNDKEDRPLFILRYKTSIELINMQDTPHEYVFADWE